MAITRSTIIKGQTEGGKNMKFVDKIDMKSADEFVRYFLSARML